ncbi:MAG TPA: hypothetical protein QF764_02065 [Planctomycetota bacterium]|jgi:hypothetical protein|nr:hypothetical protein [Planctomycetota bacterium]
MFRLHSTSIALVTLTCLAATAGAQSYSEDFESLTLGFLDGQDRWHGWDANNTLFSTVVSTQNNTPGGTQSAEISVGADTICDFDAINSLPELAFDSGQWTLSCQMFVEGGFQGQQYYMVMNDYNDFGPYEWNVMLQFDSASSNVICSCGSNGPPVTMPIQFDDWAEIRCEFDLDADNVDLYYDNQFVGSYPPSLGVFGSDSYASARIDAIDLYPDAAGFPNTTPVYYDDFSLEQVGGTLGTSFCSGDGTGTACPCGNNGGVGEGCGNSSGSGGTLSATGDSSAGGSQTYEAGNLIPGQPALLFSGNNAINGGLGIPFGDGLRCAGQGVLRHGVRSPNAGGDASWASPLPNEAWGPGDTKHFQGWYRDPSGSPCGNGFNLTTGHTISFN